ncbi:hypothetical protein C8R44DRAFT_749148 [Mycena epipterygia]|nr:hypothetical protein C8R44DRAFT_749148 [Mycena epipterygia]
MVCMRNREWMEGGENGEVAQQQGRMTQRTHFAALTPAHGRHNGPAPAHKRHPAPAIRGPRGRHPAPTTDRRTPERDAYVGEVGDCTPFELEFKFEFGAGDGRCKKMRSGGRGKKMRWEMREGGMEKDLEEKEGRKCAGEQSDSDQNEANWGGGGRKGIRGKQNAKYGGRTERVENGREIGRARAGREKWATWNDAMSAEK